MLKTSSFVKGKLQRVWISLPVFLFTQAVYRLQDDADEWEKGYRAHPSILDSALQSSSAIRNT